MSNYDIVEYGFFDSPRKTVYSGFHHALLVMGNYTVYSFDPSTLVKKPIQAAEDNYFSDIAVSSNGNMLLLVSPKTVGNALARVFDRDLFHITFQLVIDSSTTTQWQFRKGVFIDSGKAVVAGELITIPYEPEGFGKSSSSSSSQSIFSSGNQSSELSGSLDSPNIVRFYVLDYVNQQSVTTDVQTKGNIISLSFEPRTKTVVAVTSSGDVLTMQTDALTYVVKNAGRISVVADSTITCATAFAQSIATSVVPEQEATRVYVGSKPWASDRWDSGEVVSSETSMLYGGGDNLKPGQKYWVHIMVKTNGQWSAPQIRSFIVPKE
jgi:hypothetical protein